MQGLGIRSGRKLTCFDLTRSPSHLCTSRTSHISTTPRLMPWDVVTGPTNQGEHKHVDHVAHRDFALSHAHSLHQNQVEACRFAELDGF